VAVFAPATQQSNPQVQVTYVNADAITGQASLSFSDPSVNVFWPQLQREDGSYIGTAGDFNCDGKGLNTCNPAPPYNPYYDNSEPVNENAMTLAAVGPSGVIWQQPFSSPVLPLYATFDGGMIVTSSQSSDPESQVEQFTLGTLYTLDQNGNITSQTTDTGAVPSWTNQWYVDPPGTASAVAQPAPPYTGTFAAITGGNQSDNGTAIDQVATNEPQGNVHQVPDSDAAPPCLFTGLQHPQALCSNYNGLELLTTVSPSVIFSRYLQTFLGAQPQQLPNPSDDVAQVPEGTDVTASGQTVTFTLQGLPSFGQSPFSVQVERFDPSANTMSVVTLQGHPLAGWRYWRAYSVGTNDVVIETGAVDTWGPGPKNYLGYWLFRGSQTKMWQEFLGYIPYDIRKKLDPSVIERFGTYPTQGVWNPTSPSQAAILYQVCQSTASN
jgi:hypothetical protein